MYSRLLGKVPTQTQLIHHDVQLIDLTPIRLHPYRVTPEKRHIIQQEVDLLLQHGSICPSKSSWSSPCLLVPKSDGTWILCVNYWRLNMVTVDNVLPLSLFEECIDQIEHTQFVSNLIFRIQRISLNTNNRTSERSNSFYNP